MNVMSAGRGLMSFAVMCAFSAVAAGQVMIAPPQTVLPPAWPERAADVFKDSTCIEYSTCPADVLLSTLAGNVSNCNVEVESGDCSGTCSTCAGANGKTRVCTSEPLYNGTIPSSYRIVGCGNRRRHTSTCTNTKPSGLPTTPNGCYCNLGLGYTYETIYCQIGECQL